MKKKITLLAFTLVFSTALWAQQTLLAYFPFTNNPATPNTPTSFLAPTGEQSGTAAIYLNGSHGSSTWLAAELNSFGGTTINAYGGEAADKDLALVGNTANQKSMVIHFSTTGYQNVVVTFAFRRSATGFNSHVWAYSTDGTNFTTIPGNNTGDAEAGNYALATLDLTSITAINDQANVYLRVTLDGASSTSASNRFDNIQINGTPSGPDIYPPRLLSHEVPNATTVRLTFNEALDMASAQTLTNYTFTQSHSVSSVMVNDNRIVTLTVNPALVEGNQYNLTIRNIEDAAGNAMADSVLTFNYGIAQEYHKATIAALRAAAPEYNGAGNYGTTVYKYTGEAVITYMITNRNQKYIQDETGAILIDDAEGIITSSLETGDALSNIYGTLTNYYGLIQFTPTQDASAVSFNNDVTPEDVALTALDSNRNNSLQSKLIRLDNVFFTTTGNFTTNQYYDLRQGTTTNAGAVFTNNWNADYIGSAIPTYQVDLTGVVTYSYEKNRIIILNKNAMVSLHDIALPAIRLSPNPARDFVIIETGEPVQMDIYSLTGSLILRHNYGEGSHLISTQEMTPGMYMIRLTNSQNGNVRTTKLVIQ